ncbi:YdcF family protein [Pseudothermotoga sp. U03pept]|uniref:YdcF family protein n=1 Tax=Pseudothermotoga sp. U03pept TaxID=3447012 RepID=UPI003EFF4393
MVVFQKIAEGFVLPPGVFVTLFLVAALFAVKRQKKLSFVSFILAFVFYFLSTGIGVLFLLNPIEKISISCDQEVADAVVVLGGGVVKTPYGYELSLHTASRLLKGLEMAKLRNLPLIITGGKIPQTDRVPEAEVMKEKALKLGFDDKDIIVESTARTTYENALRTLEIIREHGFEKVLLVTSAIHMKRAIYSFKSVGVQVIPCPSNYLYDHAEFKWIDFVPNRDALDANLAAIHEIFGIIWYKLIDLLR